MAKLRRIVGKTFTDQRVELDGCDFDDCTFTRCTLAFSGRGRFTFVGGSYDGSQIQFEGAAERTLTAVRSLKQFGFADIADQIIAGLSAPFAGDKAN